MTASKKTIADLRAIHDKSVVIPNRIKGALAALKASGDAWTYETDFIRMAKPPLSSIDISRFRDQFSEYWADMPAVDGKKTARKVWFTTPAGKKAWEEGFNG
jgi:hypothetical protein